MKNIKFLKDEKVVLKSGGPVMMIEKYIWDDFNEGYSSERVTCIWFTNSTLNREDFNTGSLEHYED
ncbi:DUF2158 domain-containing protein [Mucilaginibacter pedocola]|uniref:DUF2158 domain-containing protein n=1 Tax=Mucilaginibacter pedocola TaxID=1792845 RepID=A0A1S9PCV1_9SPHI|nr:DUF2158 domain-containing protein [Mucilaginibacter pedocola]OOQ58802.1 hypothetical protein BC343_09140 [Mucilaginibacter pedocola]